MKLQASLQAVAAALPILTIAFPCSAQDKAPSLKSIWKMDAPADCRRIGIANVAEDQKPRLLILRKNLLSVHSVGDKLSDKEASADLGDKAAQFVAGKFDKDKPVLIAVPGALFVRNGAEFTRKPAKAV